MTEEFRKLDETDIKIIKFLQKNARITASEVAQSINMSVPAVSERIRKLESCGIICGYSVLLDPLKLNRTTTAIILVSVDNPGQNTLFNEAIANEPDILESHCIAGSFDNFLKIVTKDTASLKELLCRIRSIPGVTNTDTHMILSTEKNSLPINLD